MAARADRAQPVIVAGAGVVGSAIALALAQSGLAVSLVDPLGWEDNASAVAAGMLAPAFEAALDPPMTGRFDFMKAAQALWPAFAQRLVSDDIGLRKSGALWIEPPGGDGKALAEHERTLWALGADHRRLPPAEVRRQFPELTAGAGLFTAEDWRLSPGVALKALHQAVRTAGGRIVKGRVAAFDAERALLADGQSIPAGRLVLATGADPLDLAPELAVLTPIKGQILHYPVALDPNRPVLRGVGGYVSAGADGLMVGATMEQGRGDREVDPQVVARLAGFAGGLLPQLRGMRPGARCGVRAATPDGLPLIGRSTRPGVWLAVGMRRNGWLLAPLAARMIAGSMTGGESEPYRDMLDPGRFTRR